MLRGCGCAVFILKGAAEAAGRAGTPGFHRLLDSPARSLNRELKTNISRVFSLNSVPVGPWVAIWDCVLPGLLGLHLSLGSKGDHGLTQREGEVAPWRVEG